MILIMLEYVERFSKYCDNLYGSANYIIVKW